MGFTKINTAVDHLFRLESGRMISVLSRLLGIQNIDVAQDIVQDTLLKAMTSWSYSGLPENPSAWLYRTAKNKAIDYLRREKKFKEISPHYSYLLQSEYSATATLNQLFFEDEIQDSQLRMIFACCHPSIPVESQIAVSLMLLCGLSSQEIARAFLTNEETINKRIFRAKEKIRNENIELELPSNNKLAFRLDAVLKSLYLLFNEGYNSSRADQLIRDELCEDAIRLAYLLTLHEITNLPKTQALLALFCFQASRLQARLDDKGNIILLKYQDRTKWYEPLMQKGFYYIDMAITEPFEKSVYHLEAAIASLHASAKSFEETDWNGIYFLYQQLYQLQPTSIVALNKAISMAYAKDKAAALEELLQIKELNHYYIYHTSVGEIYFESGDKSKAKEFYENALKLTNSKQEQQLLFSKIKKCLE